MHEYVSSLKLSLITLIVQLALVSQACVICSGARYSTYCPFLPSVMMHIINLQLTNVDLSADLNLFQLFVYVCVQSLAVVSGVTLYISKYFETLRFVLLS
jgi:hypothetical protein